MDSWHSVNYKTYNRTLWVQLMNSSTQDWNVGPLPPHVFARPNDTSRLPDDALVLRKAGKALIGGSPIEQVVFGIIAGLVIAWGLVWAVWTWRNRPPSSNSTASSSSSSAAAGDGRLLTAARFTEILDARYYDGIQTDLEIFDAHDQAHRQHQGHHRGPGGEGMTTITAEDVEAVTALIRHMYQIDLSIWSRESSENVSERAEQRRLRQSQSAWDEVRRKVEQLKMAEGSLKGKDEDETRSMKKHLHQIKRRVDGIPARRYGSRAT